MRLLFVFLISALFCFDKSGIYNDSWALIIGINDYEYVTQLNYAENDARSIKDLLVSDYNFRNENITLILNEEATKDNILKGFNKILLNADEDDRVLIFFAGHGETFTLPKGGDKGYLMPVDASADDLFLTAIPMKTIYEIAEMSYAKHILYLVDACYGGLSISSRGLKKSSNEDIYLQKITRESGRQVITAGGKEEKVIEKASWGHSAFTRNLLKGLGEKLADTDNDNIITATELGNFLKKRVTADSDGAHTPQTGRIGSEEGEFVFIDAAYSGDSSSPGEVAESQDISWYSNEISNLKNQLEVMSRSSAQISQSMELAKPQKPILIILPYESDYAEIPKSIQRKLTDAVTSSIGAIKRFRVVDRNDIKNILKEKKFQSASLSNDSFSEMANILASKEALQIKGINFGQMGVAKAKIDYEEDSEEVKLAKLKYGYQRASTADTLNNIRTNLFSEIRKINIDTGEILDSQTFEIVHEGGNRTESLGKTLVKLQQQVGLWLKMKFKLQSTVVQVDGDDLVVMAGEDVGVKEGTIYNIQRQEEVKVINGQKISIAGKNIGLAKVYKVGKNSSNAKVIQKWGDIKEGQKLDEFRDMILHIDYLVNSSFSDVALSMKVQATQKPRMFRREWLVGGGARRNLAGNLFYNFHFSPVFKLDTQSRSAIRFYPYASIPLNITLGKADKYESQVLSIGLTPQVGIEVNAVMGPGKEYVLQAGYSIQDWQTGWASDYCSKNDSGEYIHEQCNEPGFAGTSDELAYIFDDIENSGFDARTWFVSLGIKLWNIDNKFW